MPSTGTNKRHVRYDCPNCGKHNTDMTEVTTYINGAPVSQVTTCDNCEAEIKPT